MSSRRSSNEKSLGGFRSKNFLSFLSSFVELCGFGDPIYIDILYTGLLSHFSERQAIFVEFHEKTPCLSWEIIYVDKHEVS